MAASNADPGAFQAAKAAVQSGRQAAAAASASRETVGVVAQAAMLVERSEARKGSLFMSGEDSILGLQLVYLPSSDANGLTLSSGEDAKISSYSGAGARQLPIPAIEECQSDTHVQGDLSMGILRHALEARKQSYGLPEEEKILLFAGTHHGSLLHDQVLLADERIFRNGPCATIYVRTFTSEEAFWVVYRNSHAVRGEGAQKQKQQQQQRQQKQKPPQKLMNSRRRQTRKSNTYT